jgi:GNAT superfamily N-acetyltransferase
MTGIAHYIGLNRTPALPLAVRGWFALIEADHCSNYVQVTADQNALVAFVDDTAAAVLTYRYEPSLKEFQVGIGYTLPAYRGQGLYSALWAALVARAQQVEVVHIASAVFLNNGAMRAVAQAQGRIERTVTLDYTVP